MVEIGYKNKCSESGLINGKIPVWVNNLSDLKNIGKENIVIISRVGNKTRMEMVKEIIAKKFEVFNLNTRKFMKEMERQQKIKNKGKKTEVKEEKSLKSRSLKNEP